MLNAHTERKRDLILDHEHAMAQPYGRGRAVVGEDRQGSCVTSPSSRWNCPGT